MQLPIRTFSTRLLYPRRDIAHLVLEELFELSHTEQLVARLYGVGSVWEAAGEFNESTK